MNETKENVKTAFIFIALGMLIAIVGSAFSINMIPTYTYGQSLEQYMAQLNQVMLFIYLVAGIGGLLNLYGFYLLAQTYFAKK